MGMWRPNKGKGWGQRQEAEPANRFTQILHTILEVVPGGVIRYGKAGPDDDSHTGFWLGVTPQGIAKFSIGGPGGWLKWDGENLHVRGALETFAGDYWPNWLAFYGADGEPAGHIMGHDAWGHQIDIATPRQDAAGDPGMITLECDGDFDALVRLRLYTERGAGGAGAYIDMQIGNGNTVFKVEGNDGAVWIRGVLNCADPTADTHAVTRRAGDARYARLVHAHALLDLQQGGAQVGDVVRWNGTAWTPASPAAGTSDHGALTGLGDDDHPQYLNQARADALYSEVDHTHAPAELQGDAAETGDVLTWNGSVWTPADAPGVTAHSALSGLDGDDHVQYLNASRGDARYAGLSHGHALTSLQAGGAAPGNTLVWNGSAWAPAAPSSSVTDHGALTGLADDDHLQYLTNARADARYLRSSVGWSGTIPIGVGKSLTVVNGQITNATF